MFNLAEHFVDRHVREGRGGKTAILCGNRSLTYADVSALVNRAGNGLREFGVQEEQRVLLVLPDGPEFAAAYFGAIKIGAVAVPTSTALRAADYAYFLEESRARAALVHPSLADLVDPRRRIVLTEEWFTRQSAELNPTETREDDAAFWLWTSGSTGTPKAAVHLHQDWLHCCSNYATGVLQITKADTVFSSSKLFHAYGLGNGLMFPFHAGATTILHSAKPQAREILKISQRATLFFSVPTLYAAMLEVADSVDLSRVRLAISAAEPLPAEIFRRWKERFNIEILDGIGSTEVLHIYISARPGKVKPGSSGQPVAGYSIRIVDDLDVDVAPGTIGDLLVRGESTAACYWNRPELSAQRMRGEWFASGDKYWMDADGYYWYAGRSDDMFRVSGQWLSPAEVEGALAEHSAVLEAAVVAYPEANELHTPKAFVVLRDGFGADDELADELKDFVKRRITPYKYPRRIEFVPELPKSAAGKLLRYKLRE